jgi:signal transduction histidine kinase
MHTDDISNVCADIARLELNKGDFRAAKEYAGRALGAAKESGHKETMANALMAWAEYSNKAGDRSNAYEALHEATVLNDSVVNAAIVKQASSLSAFFENDKKEKTIAQLETERRIQAASVKQKTLLNIIFIITIAALLIIGVITGLNIKKERKLEQQRMLKLEDEKQMMGIEAMLKGQEEERRRLAKDLHDGLGGMLSGVKISFSNMKDHIDLSPANALLFEKSLGQLDNTISEMRKVAHNLMPGALIRFGLKSAVRDFCESMQLSAKANVICEQFGTDRELGSIADVNIYRIIQELVTNSVKHGHAGQVLVQLTIAAENVLISVEDDGRGFDLAAVQARPGIGLSNIRHRVNYFSGKMDIESKPGEGTTVNIELIV